MTPTNLGPYKTPEQVAECEQAHQEHWKPCPGQTASIWWQCLVCKREWQRV